MMIKFPSLVAWIAFAASVAMPVTSFAGRMQSDRPALGFTLVDMEGRSQNYVVSSGEVTVVIFFSTRCPLSNAFNYRRNQLYKDFGNRVRFLVIDSNGDESVDEIRSYIREAEFDSPVFHDMDNQAADALGARNTTETFVLDGSGAVRYRGYIEDAPNPARTTNRGLRVAIESLLSGRSVPTPETKARGCAIRRSHPRNR